MPVMGVGVQVPPPTPAKPLVRALQLSECRMSDFLVVNRGSAVTWGFAIPVDTRAVVSTSTRARWHLPRMGKCVDQCPVSGYHDIYEFDRY